jgi:hypothetical protein
MKEFITAYAMEHKCFEVLTGMTEKCGLLACNAT